MKIAGRKNDGAWYRTNRAIKRLSPAEKTELASNIQAMETIAAFVDTLNTLANDAGFNAEPGGALDAETLAQTYADNGIPRQVWLGVLSYSSYTKVPKTGGGFVYVKDGEASVRAFAIDLRYTVTKYLFAKREIKDVLNAETRSMGNPGGIADATLGD